MTKGLNKNQQMVKRVFDIVFSFLGIMLLFFPVLLLVLIAGLSTGKNGLFVQDRVGKDAVIFKMYKIRTMKADGDDNFITILNDKRITGFGRFLRKFKLDELPQLVNVLIGDMSLVGPRPDVKGYADMLKGNDRIILSVRPGITGPATLKFKDEDQLLARQKDPKKYNDEVIWPEKVRINIQYVQNWSLWKDITIIFKTIF